MGLTFPYLAGGTQGRTSGPFQPGQRSHRPASWSSGWRRGGCRDVPGAARPLRGGVPWVPAPTSPFRPSVPTCPAQVLLSLSDEDLELGLGVCSSLHRRKLRLAIEDYRDAEAGRR